MFLSSAGDAILPRLIVLVDRGVSRAAVSSAAARLSALGVLPSAACDLTAVLSMKAVSKPPVSLFLSITDWSLISGVLYCFDLHMR